MWLLVLIEGIRVKFSEKWRTDVGINKKASLPFAARILDNAEYIARSTVIPVPEADLDSNELKEQMSKFMNSVNGRIGNDKQASYDSNEAR